MDIVDRVYKALFGKIDKGEIISLIRDDQVPLTDKVALARRVNANVDENIVYDISTGRKELA